jgi:hypothetical protein
MKVVCVHKRLEFVCVFKEIDSVHSDSDLEHDAKMVVCMDVLWDQYSSAKLVELFPLLNFVLKIEFFFHCYKLCGVTQVWVERIASSDIVKICVRVKSV